VAGKAVWLACDGGLVLSSQDEGASWQERLRNPEWRFRSIEFLDQRRGLLAGDEGLLLVTRNGGNGWTQIDTGTSHHLTDIALFGENVWVAGYGGVMLHSGDGGESWQRQWTFAGASLECVSFLDERSGWAVGWSGTVLRTTDGGNTWRATPVPDISETLTSIYFKDERNGWITASWQLAGISADVFLGRLLAEEDRIWIVGPSGVLVRHGSQNGWRRLSTLDLPRRQGAETVPPPLRESPPRPARRSSG
jgi:photosystem II stability/assembly factor-like uncharacterized protein